MWFFETKIPLRYKMGINLLIQKKQPKQIFEKLEVQISNKIDKRNDHILLDNSSFGVYLNEFEKIFSYRDNILTKNTYMNGRKRVAKGKLSRLFFDGLDIFKSRSEND